MSNIMYVFVLLIALLHRFDVVFTAVIEGCVTKSSKYVDGNLTDCYECCCIGDIEISSEISSVETRAFANCLISSAVIPTTITTIKQEAFYRCEDLNEVSLPSTLSFIEQAAFVKAPFEQLALPMSLEYIGNDAFFGSALQEISIPNYVTEIGDSAFSRCDSLSKITLQTSIRKIGNDAFGNANNAPCNSGDTTLIVPIQMDPAVYEDVVFSCGNASYFTPTLEPTSSYPTEVPTIVPTAVATGTPTSPLPTVAPSEPSYVPTFQPSEVPTEAPVPVPTGAPVGNPTVSPAVQAIPSASPTANPTFTRACKDRNSYYDGGRLRSCDGCCCSGEIEVSSMITSVDSYAFYQCAGITGVVMPGTISSIGDYAFALSNAADITLPTSVLAIGLRAFGSSRLAPCSSNTATLVIPTFLDVSIYSPHVYNCKVEPIVVPTNYPTALPTTPTEMPTFIPTALPTATLQCVTKNSFFNGAVLSTCDGCCCSREVEISTSVTSIESRAFAECDLTSIKLPTTIASVGDFAFGSNTMAPCNGAGTTLLIPDTITTNVYYSAVFSCVLETYFVPTAAPSVSPPTPTPTAIPTMPTTAFPTVSPSSAMPTDAVTDVPTRAPTEIPTAAPSQTATPTVIPTHTITTAPTAQRGGEIIVCQSTLFMSLLEPNITDLDDLSQESLCSTVLLSMDASNSSQCEYANMEQVRRRTLRAKSSALERQIRQELQAGHHKSLTDTSLYLVHLELSIPMDDYASWDGVSTNYTKVFNTLLSTLRGSIQSGEFNSYLNDYTAVSKSPLLVNATCSGFEASSFSVISPGDPTASPVSDNDDLLPGVDISSATLSGSSMLYAGLGVGVLLVIVLACGFYKKSFFCLKGTTGSKLATLGLDSKRDWKVRARKNKVEPLTFPSYKDNPRGYAIELPPGSPGRESPRRSKPRPKSSTHHRHHPHPVPNLVEVRPFSGREFESKEQDDHEMLGRGAVREEGGVLHEYLQKVKTKKKEAKLLKRAGTAERSGTAPLPGRDPRAPAGPDPLLGIMIGPSSGRENDGNKKKGKKDKKSKDKINEKIKVKPKPFK